MYFDFTVYMSPLARYIGLIIALLMAAFSAYVYTNTGDWVAAVFCLGSVGYCLFFASGRAKNG